MLQHLQLIKPKKKITKLTTICKIVNKTRYNKNMTSLSYQLKGDLHLHLFLQHF